MKLLFASRNLFVAKHLLIVCFLTGLCPMATAADKWEIGESLLLEGIPETWRRTSLADEIEVNGMPIRIFVIGAPQSLKDAALMLSVAWARAKWSITTRAVGENVNILGVKGGWSKQAILSAGDNGQVEGYLSISDLPGIMNSEKERPAQVLGKHLRKPIGTRVLNEVRTVDNSGTSVLSTMTNTYSIEQNVAFYQEDRAAEAWKLAYKRVTDANGATVFKYVSGERKEATYTVSKIGQQTYVVVNWIIK